MRLENISKKDCKRSALYMPQQMSQHTVVVHLHDIMLTHA